VVLAHVFRLSN